MDTPRNRRRPPRHKFSPAAHKALQNLCQIRKDWPALVAVAEDWAIISAALLLGLTPWMGAPLWTAAFVWPIAWIVIGTRMRGLATLVHEASHGTLTRTKWLGGTIGTVFSAWLILQMLTTFRVSHLIHHKTLGDFEDDPDIAHYVKQGLVHDDPDRFLLKHLVSMLTGVKVVFHLPYLLKHRLFPSSKAIPLKQRLEIIGFCLFWLLIFAVLTLNGWWLQFIVLWVMPLLTVFPGVGFLIESAEHFPLVWLHDEHINMTRNRKGHALERFFFGIHAEHLHRTHHERPGIPFFLLRQADEIMMSDPVYAAFEAHCGGLLTKGPNGELPIIQVMPVQLKQVQSKL